ncbi:hypothetical protein [Gynuella sunshinyii]|uniref:Uncharacterized protein n=1 Tax=Gynuella sunshinyii YC6258 TaxID=1445510 RepID=A0A0C5VEA2_9GAMM|nr:hypothetical protein [Gynuella sunshinyii]AJQ92852.1 hypothetical Protein YC6258_00802 [Gynuella sunshinyii YC6258]
MSDDLSGEIAFFLAKAPVMMYLLVTDSGEDQPVSDHEPLKQMLSQGKYDLLRSFIDASGLPVDAILITATLENEDPLAYLANVRKVADAVLPENIAILFKQLLITFGKDCLTGSGDVSELAKNPHGLACLKALAAASAALGLYDASEQG